MELLIQNGDPLDVIPDLVSKLGATQVAWSEIPGYYECRQSSRLKEVLLPLLGSEGVITTCSYTLYHPDDLPCGGGGGDRIAIWRDLARPNEMKPKERRRRAVRKQRSAPSASDDDVVIDATGTRVGGGTIYECSSHHPHTNGTTNVDVDRFVGMPRVMGDYRRAVRTYAKVRDLFGLPRGGGTTESTRIGTSMSSGGMVVDAGDMPSLEELLRPLLESSVPILGGCVSGEMIRNMVECAVNRMPRADDVDDRVILEVEAIRHMRDYVRHHASSANRSLCDVSNNQSSKLSVYLALGLLSPRQVYHCALDQMRREEDDVENNDAGAGPNWIISHMEMRDFFIFDSFRNGISAHNLYPMGHPTRKPLCGGFATPWEWLPLKSNEGAFTLWASGRTNLPLVDAGMKELVTTGYISNRIRQNLASVLTKDLRLDWRLGAEFFRLCLEDHCPGANYGNWTYFAGVGGDPKDRHFRTVSQARRYDPDGTYVRKWIDRFDDMGDISEDGLEVMLRPWDFLKDWGTPMVPLETQLTWQDRERLKNMGRIRD
jgi:deoxyribodipyrimidine photo-lyase